MFEDRIRELCINDPRWAPHVRRYCESWEALKEYCDITSLGKFVVECGEANPFTRVLKENGVCVFATQNEDLRSSAMSLPLCEPKSADVVLCMEVIEHLKDFDPRDMWTGSSLSIVLNACMNTLKPGGKLFLSTPNACSWITLFRWLKYQHPWQFRPHVMELAPEEVSDAIRHAGMIVEKMWTSDVWCRHGMPDQIITSMMHAFNLNPNELRGDCLFLVARA